MTSLIELGEGSHIEYVQRLLGEPMVEMMGASPFVLCRLNGAEKPACPCWWLPYAKIYAISGINGPPCFKCTNDQLDCDASVCQETNVR